MAEEDRYSPNSEARSARRIAPGPGGGSDVSYARELRALGQALERLKPASFTLEREGAAYTVRGIVRETSAVSFLARFARYLLRCGNPKHKSERVIEISYSQSQIGALEESESVRRADGDGVPDPRSISQVLRAVGTFLDLSRASALRDIVFKDGWVTVRYESAEGCAEQEKQDLDYFYDFWVKMYLRRKRREANACASEPTLYVKWERDLERLKD